MSLAQKAELKVRRPGGRAERRLRAWVRQNLREARAGQLELGLAAAVAARPARSVPVEPAAALEEIKGAVAVAAVAAEPPA